MESLESVEISFGTLFRVKIAGKEIDRTDMVFDIGQGDWFFSAFLFKTPEGKTAWRWAGTGGSENVSRVVGQMTPEEVIEAARAAKEAAGQTFSQEDLEELQGYAKKGSRSLLLTQEK